MVKDTDEDQGDPFKSILLQSLQAQQVHVEDGDVLESVLKAVKEANSKASRQHSVTPRRKPKASASVFDDMQKDREEVDIDDSGRDEADVPIKKTMKAVAPKSQVGNEWIPKPSPLTAATLKKALDMNQDYYIACRTFLRTKIGGRMREIIDRDLGVKEAIKEISRGKHLSSFPLPMKEKIIDKLASLVWTQMDERYRKTIRRETYEKFEKLTPALNDWGLDFLASKICTDKKGRLVGSSGHIRRKTLKRFLAVHIKKKGTEDMDELGVPPELIKKLDKALKLGWVVANENSFSNASPMKPGESCHISAEDWTRYERMYAKTQARIKICENIKQRKALRGKKAAASVSDGSDESDTDVEDSSFESEGEDRGKGPVQTKKRTRPEEDEDGGKGPVQTKKRTRPEEDEDGEEGPVQTKKRTRPEEDEDVAPTDKIKRRRLSPMAVDETENPDEHGSEKGLEENPHETEGQDTITKAGKVGKFKGNQNETEGQDGVEENPHETEGQDIITKAGKVGKLKGNRFGSSVKPPSKNTRQTKKQVAK